MSAPPLDITQFLPPSLNLPPHLSAHKYFFVCTLTVAAWDTLVLSPRGWRLAKTPEWPPLKIIFHLLRFLMPAEFLVVAVAFFDTKFSLSMCSHFFLFEPIVTAVLVNLCALVHAIRIYAIYDKSMPLLAALGTLLVGQAVVMGVCVAFFRVMPLLEGQGCIAGPKHNWVGVYWLAPTIYFAITFGLALTRSLQSRATKPLGSWKLMLRDGLNLYGAVFVVNLVNVVFWFVATPTDDKDTIKTIVTSMAAVLTTTMTLRIILAVRGSLANGGAYAGTSTSGAHNTSGARGTTHVVSTGTRPGVVGIGAASAQLRSAQMHSAAHGMSAGGGMGMSGPNGAYTLEEMRAKAERDWNDSNSIEGRDKAPYGVAYGGEDEIKPTPLGSADDVGGVAPVPAAYGGAGGRGVGVKVTIDREVDFRGYGKQ